MKYQILTNQHITIAHPRTKRETKLYRILALTDLKIGKITVKEGDIGGYIQSEKNLPNALDDNSWVAHTAMVFDNAILTNGSVAMQKSAIYDDAILDNTMAKENARAYGQTKLVNSQISGNVDIYDQAQLEYVMCVNASKIGGKAVVKNSKLYHGAFVTDTAYLEGCELYDMCRVYGKSRLINCFLKSAMLVRDETFENQTLTRDIELNASYPEIQGQF